MKTVADVASAIVVVAGIMVLVRPGSRGPEFVTAIGKSFAATLVAATGGGGTLSWSPG